MKGKIIPSGVALICSALFLIMVLAPGGCGFNFLPYEIHESISRGGENESIFITIFDILFSVLIFVVAYWIVGKVSWKKSK
jgi:hypothetical protein